MPRAGQRGAIPMAGQPPAARPGAGPLAPPAGQPLGQPARGFAPLSGPRGPVAGSAPGAARVAPLMAGGFKPPAAAPNPAMDAMNKMFGDQLGVNTQMRGQLMDMGQANIAALQRRNGANAAMGGRSIGGGYLGGQRSALTQGLGAMNEAMLGNDQQRMQIMGDQLRTQLDQSNRAQDRQNFLDDRDEGRKYGNEKDKAAAQAEKDKQLRQSNVDRLKASWEQRVGKLGSDPWVENLLNEYLITGDDSNLRYLEEEMVRRGEVKPIQIS